MTLRCFSIPAGAMISLSCAALAVSGCQLESSPGEPADDEDADSGLGGTHDIPEDPGTRSPGDTIEGAWRLVSVGGDPLIYELYDDASRCAVQEENVIVAMVGPEQGGGVFQGALSFGLETSYSGEECAEDGNVRVDDYGAGALLATRDAPRTYTLEVEDFGLMAICALNERADEMSCEDPSDPDETLLWKLQ